MLINFSWQALLTFWSPPSSPSFSVSLYLHSQSLKHLLIRIISLSHSNHLHFFCSSCPAHLQSIPHSHLVFLPILGLSARPPTSFSPSVAPCANIHPRCSGRSDALLSHLSSSLSLGTCVCSIYSSLISRSQHFGFRKMQKIINFYPFFSLFQLCDRKIVDTIFGGTTGIIRDGECVASSKKCPH